MASQNSYQTLSIIVKLKLNSIEQAYGKTMNPLEQQRQMSPAPWRYTDDTEMMLSLEGVYENAVLSDPATPTIEKHCAIADGIVNRFWILDWLRLVKTELDIRQNSWMIPLKRVIERELPRFNALG